MKKEMHIITKYQRFKKVGTNWLKKWYEQVDANLSSTNWLDNFWDVKKQKERDLAQQFHNQKPPHRQHYILSRVYKQLPLYVDLWTLKEQSTRKSLELWTAKFCLPHKRKNSIISSSVTKASEVLNDRVLVFGLWQTQAISCYLGIRLASGSRWRFNLAYMQS